MCLLQITLAVVFSGWAHVLHAVFKPWGRDSLTYKVQHLSLFTTTFVFVMGLLFKVKGVNTDAASFKALSAIMLLLCLSFSIVWLVSLTIGVRATLARKRLAKQARRVKLQVPTTPLLDSPAPTATSDEPSPPSSDSGPRVGSTSRHVVASEAVRHPLPTRVRRMSDAANTGATSAASGEPLYVAGLRGASFSLRVLFPLVYCRRWLMDV